MTKQVEACCSSPATICYWFMVSLMAWGVLSLIGIFWRPLHASSAAACLFAMAIGCIANWFKNRSLHCTITGPLFLIGGIMFLLSGVGMFPRRDTLWVWPVLLIGIGIAFVGMAVREASCVLTVDKSRLRSKPQLTGEQTAQACDIACVC
jgi:hypothetical protein